MNVSPFLSVNHSCDEAMQWANEKLLQAGLRPVQTFDLHTARMGLHDCPCPNHGTNDCDCQLVVMLVYGKTGDPASLILHGNDGQTWLSMAEAPAFHAAPPLVYLIKNTLCEGLLVETTNPE